MVIVHLRKETQVILHIENLFYDQGLHSSTARLTSAETGCNINGISQGNSKHYIDLSKVCAKIATTMNKFFVYKRQRWWKVVKRPSIYNIT